MNGMENLVFCLWLLLKVMCLSNQWSLDSRLNFLLSNGVRNSFVTMF